MGGLAEPDCFANVVDKNLSWLVKKIILRKNDKRRTVELTRAAALPSSLAGPMMMRKSLPVAPVQRFVG